VVGVFVEMSGDVNRRETIRSERKRERERIGREEKAKDRKKEERGVT